MLQLGGASARTSITVEGWKRITFLYTTGELLNQAATINELVVRAEKRKVLWQSLRERLASGDESNGLEMDNDFDDPLLFETLLKWMDLPPGNKNQIYGI